MRLLLTLVQIVMFAGSASAQPSHPTIDSAFLDHPGRIEVRRAADVDRIDLKQTLVRMARIAAIYEREALGFTVDESTSVITHDYRNGFKTTYNAPESVYCYYDAGHGRLDDRRVEKRRVKNLHRRMARGDDISLDLTTTVDPLKNNQAVPSYVERPYSWILLFSSRQQARYSYHLEGMHKKGIVIGFEPSASDGAESDWYGRVVVDPESYQIVRAEGQQRLDIQDLRSASRLLHSDRELPREPQERTFVETLVQAEFGTVQGGMRLPTKVETTVFHHVIAQPVSQKIDRLRRVHEVVQKYRRYKFFGVDVEEEITAVRLAED